MYNDQLGHNEAIWAFFGISFWTEKEALRWPYMTFKSKPTKSDIIHLNEVYICVKQELCNKHISVFVDWLTDSLNDSLT